MPIDEIKGYTEFMRAISSITSDMPKEMATTANDIAREWVGLAQSAATAPQQALAAQSLSYSADELGAQISADSPLFFGAEFGGQGRPSTMQFPPYQGKRGYFLFPTARANADRFNEQWVKAIDKSMEPWNHQER